MEELLILVSVIMVSVVTETEFGGPCTNLREVNEFDEVFKVQSASDQVEVELARVWMKLLSKLVSAPGTEFDLIYLREVDGVLGS